MKKRLLKVVLVIAGGLFLFLGGCYGLFQVSKLRNFQFFGGLTSHVNTEEKVVALTFDDAPSEFTDEVLATLVEKQVPATFYMIGQAMEQYPDQAKAIAEAGMELGNHSYSHQRFLLKSQSFIDTEIQTTDQLIRDAGYQGEITFRPPNGKKLFGLPWYLRQHQIKTIMWDVEPDTYIGELDGDERTQFLIDYTMKHVQPGSIILLHPFCESCQSDREAIEPIIDLLQAKGYRLVTVSKLLSSQEN